MHHIYHTEGLILDSKNFGESGKYYYIFTRDLGMVLALAQGIRKISSKLRFVLQDYSYVKVDFVQGKDIWRITSASKNNGLEHISKNPESLLVFSNVARLLKRLLAGEDANEILFSDVIKGLSMLELSDSKEETGNIEALIVLRILNNLGYIGGNETVNNLIKSPFDMDTILNISKSRTMILSEINKALKETHL